MTDFPSHTHLSGIPDMNALSTSLLVPFEVDPLEEARTVWINRRWFLQAGIDVGEPDTHAKLCRDLAREFAVIARDTREGTDGASRPVLFADRYGATGGCPHGGSGRTGIKGAYNAKGIGRTPLCADNVTASYSNGLLSLKEAVREAVAAEITAAELPHGSVPILAIIDTGRNFTLEQGGVTQRAAIVVRPNFIRPAHFERSLFFGQAGSSDSEQYRDAIRVQTMVQAASDPRLRSAMGFAGLQAMFLAFAEQIGASRALRLWSGRFLTSNLSVGGAWVDFGSFRAVSSWRQAFGVTSEAFGDEGSAMRRSLESLCYYFKRHSEPGIAAPNPRDLCGRMDKTIQDTFQRSLLSGLGIAGSGGTKFGDELQRLGWEYYLLQQQQRVKVDKPADWHRSWIFDLLRKNSRDEYISSLRETAVARTLQTMIRREADRHAPLLGAARRWFRPRPRLYYDLASARAARLERLAISRGGLSTGEMDLYINGEISASRRHWPMLPGRLEVLGHVAEPHCSALYCFDRDAQRHTIWLDAAVCGDACYLFRRKIPIADIQNPVFTTSGKMVHFESPSEQIDLRAGTAVTVGPATVAVPEPRIRY